MEKKRLDYVDIARGLAILLVIMGHIKYTYVPFCGSVHIPVFFMLSGYLYRFDEKQAVPYGTQIAKRVKRLVIPYFIYSAILILKYFVSLIASHALTAKNVLEAIGGSIYSASILFKNVAPEDNYYGFVCGNGPLWFLTSMVVASVVFYGVMYYLMKHKFNLPKLLVVMVGLWIVSYALCRFLPIYLPWTAEMALVGTIFMIVGAILRHYDALEYAKNHWKVCGVGAIIATVCFKFLHDFNGPANMAACDYGSYLIAFIILGILGSLVFLYISVLLNKAQWITKALCYVGQRTMVILAFHMTIISVFVAVLSKLHLDHVVLWDGLWIITFPVGLFSSLLIGEIMVRFLKAPKSLL